ncbi:hypothetical protein HYQ44_013126 [Verticillium longisporum]|nr:hypothetical protein HYQ44_013126 [Verticillium longisporum]
MTSSRHPRRHWASEVCKGWVRTRIDVSRTASNGKQVWRVWSDLPFTADSARPQNTSGRQQAAGPAEVLGISAVKTPPSRDLKCPSEARATFVCKFCRNFTSVGGSQKDQRTQVISEGTLGRSIRDGIETPRPSAGRRH